MNPTAARLAGAARGPYVKGCVAENGLTQHIGRICRVPPPHTPFYNARTVSLSEPMTRSADPSQAVDIGGLMVAA